MRGDIIIIIKKGRQCKAEREWYTPYQSEDPSPTIPTYEEKEEKGKIVEDYSRDRVAKANKKALALLLKHASPTPSNARLARSFVPERHWGGTKSPAVLRGSAARRRISIPMRDEGTVCNPHWNIRSRECTIKRVHRITPDLTQHTEYCHRSTMSNVTPNHKPS